MDEINFAMDYDLEISGEMLSKIYPELKLPKPKGKFGKRKD
jgi:hypothetical protein